MVIAYHLIFSAYGFWLPNDPRGSWSDYVRTTGLLEWGHATKVETRRSVAEAAHDRRARLAAKQSLQHEPVRFTGQQAKAIGEGFAHRAARSAIRVYACAIMPDHAHLVVSQHRLPVEQIANLMKGAAAHRLSETGQHPFGEERNRRGKRPSVWANGFWKVFIHDEEHLRAAVEYVKANPTKTGFKRQVWSFVTAPEHPPLSGRR